MPLIPFFGGVGAMLGAGAATTAPAIALGVGATAAAGGAAAYGISSANQSRRDAKRSMSFGGDAGGSSLGNISEGEAQTSASKKMFREGLYFTSPTGLGTGGGSRGRSRLFGA